MFFAGGAAASVLAGMTYNGGGWTVTCAAGMGFAAVGLLVYGSEFMPRRRLLAKAASLFTR